MRIKQGQTGRLIDRQKSLLEIINNFSTVLERPTSALLHEYIFLCRVYAKNLCHIRDYDFHAYIRGPFSEQLRADLQILADRGLIEFNQGRLTVSSSGKQLIQELEKEGKFQSDRSECQKILSNFGSTRAISQGIHDQLSETALGETLSLP